MAKEYAKEAKDIAWKIDALLAKSDFRLRVLDALVVFAANCKVDGDDSRWDQDSEGVLDLADRYALVASVHDVICTKSQPVRPPEWCLEEGAKPKSALRYAAIGRSHVENWKRYGSRVKRCWAQVKADLLASDKSEEEGGARWLWKVRTLRGHVNDIIPCEGVRLAWAYGGVSPSWHTPVEWSESFPLGCLVHRSRTLLSPRPPISRHLKGDGEFQYTSRLIYIELGQYADSAEVRRVYWDGADWREKFVRLYRNGPQAVCEAFGWPSGGPRLFTRFDMLVWLFLKNDLHPAIDYVDLTPRAGHDWCDEYLGPHGEVFGYDCDCRKIVEYMLETLEQLYQEHCGGPTESAAQSTDGAADDGADVLAGSLTADDNVEEADVFKPLGKTGHMAPNSDEPPTMSNRGYLWPFVRSADSDALVRTQLDRKTRLLALCRDMILRLEANPDDFQFGNIGGQIGEAGRLAVALGFLSPPIQITQYTPTWTAIEPDVGFSWPAPADWPQLRESKCVWEEGYRLHDPVGDRPEDIPVTRLVEPESHGPSGSNEVRDELGSQSRSEISKRLVKALRLWIIALEGFTVTDADTGSANPSVCEGMAKQSEGDSRGQQEESPEDTNSGGDDVGRVAEMAGQPQGGTQEQPWQDEAPGYLPLSQARKLIDDRYTLGALSKLCKPDGAMRYMRKGQRCKVHLADFRAYMRGQQSDPRWARAYMAYLNAAGKGDTRFFWHCKECGEDTPESSNASVCCPKCSAECELISKKPPAPGR